MNENLSQGLSQNLSQAKNLKNKYIAFTVYGIPRPQGSKQPFTFRDKRTGKVRASLSESGGKNLAAWRNDVSIMAQQHRPEKPFDEAVSVTLKFYFIRPKSISKKKRPYPSVRPDIDKLTRAIFDALKGKVYTDDSRVCDLIALKRYDDVSRVEIEVERLPASDIKKENRT